MAEDLDVAIVGGGPGGLSAGVCASLADSHLKIKVCGIAIFGAVGLRFRLRSVLLSVPSDAFIVFASDTFFHLGRYLNAHHPFARRDSLW